MRVLTICALLIAVCSAYDRETNTISGTIRDVWPCKTDDPKSGLVDECGQHGVKKSSNLCKDLQCHPDFEMASGGTTKNLVLPYMDANRKPIFNPAMTYPNKQQTISNNGAYFQWWFTTNSSYNMAFTTSLTMDNFICPGGAKPPCPGDGAVFGYINGSYWPLSNMGYGNYPGFTSKNFHFCLELHVRFTYRGFEVFSFTGDDDIWVFINNVLVVDIGGIHQAETESIQLNNSKLLPGLVIGQNYPFDMFYCERHTSQSDLSVFTDLALECSYYDWCGVCQGNGQSCCNKCDDNDVCTVDSCNVFNGACIHQQVVCPGDLTNLCAPIKCSASRGCFTDKLNCNDSNPCTRDTCSRTSGCSNTPIVCNDQNTCTVDFCNATNPEDKPCTFQPLDRDPCSGLECVPGQNVSQNAFCNTTDLCFPLTCIDKKCQYISNVTCDDKNLCTTDYCLNGVCYHDPINCDDKNNCTYDSCMNGTCLHVDRTKTECITSNACTVASCDPKDGCTFTNLTVPPIQNCKVSYCDEVVGIVSNDLLCTPKSTCKCDPDQNACVCTPFIQTTAAKISAGVLAAVIVGVVAAVVIFAIVSKKGYDYYKKAHTGQAKLASNPLYEDKMGQGDNPLFQEKAI